MEATKTIRNMDVLDCEADALIYSTNVLLNCSGGVGACLLKRYGPLFQEALHNHLKESGRKFATQGEVIELTTDLMPYKKVFHTLPCDPFYNTSPEIITSLLEASLRECQSSNIDQIAMSALGTGYGHMSFDQFLRTASEVFRTEEFQGLQISLCVQDEYSYGLACEQIGAEKLGISPMS